MLLMSDKVSPPGFVDAVICNKVILVPGSKLAVVEGACKGSKMRQRKVGVKWDNRKLPLLYFAIPPFDALSFATNFDVQVDVFHAFYVLHKVVVAHASGVRSVRR